MRILCITVSVLILLCMLLEADLFVVKALTLKFAAISTLILISWYINICLVILKISKTIRVLQMRRQYCHLLRKCIRSASCCDVKEFGYLLETFKNKELQTEKAYKLLGIYICNTLAYNQL